MAARRFGFGTTAGIRLLLMPARVGRETFVVAVAQSLAAQEETLADLREAMLITGPLALLIATVGGYILARKSLRPVVRMSEKARAISATNLSERIEVVNQRDELGALAATLNDLLARLDRAFTAQRRFMADASHELRSPVAILQGELDVTLSRDDRNAAEYRESLEVMRRSVRRLTRIVRDLFLLARSDAGEVPLRREPVSLGDIIGQTVRALRTVAAERQVTLNAGCDSAIVVTGDEDLLQRMTANLIENAIKYTKPGTEVCIRCTAAGTEARIEVRDHGAGVPPELQEQIFERFFRVDPVRSGGSGAGLGLPIARWIAEAHGGAVRLEKSDATGSVFVATLRNPHSATRNPRKEQR
jgi:heavy metal sensor kinase